MIKLHGFICYILICSVIISCGEIKRINRGNYVFRYVDNQDRRNRDDSSVKDSLYVYKTTEVFKSKIEVKEDYIILKGNTPLAGVKIDSVKMKPSPLWIATKGSFYTAEIDEIKFDSLKESFVYSDIKFAIQALTIPLKFRGALDDGTKFPAQVETGINIGFAPVVKYSINVHDPVKRIMGKVLNQYSINSGLVLNLGATDLKAASNAPGLISDRKAPLFSYGTFLMFGVNNINFGYAVGWDSIIGEGRSNWVYQNKMWHGLIIGLDIIKP